MLSFEELLLEAKKAREKAYAKYSSFKVGAVIECKDGKLIYGSNIENASYGLSMCAERNAIFQAHLLGYKKEDYLQLCIVSDSNDITSPCGACRQVLSELFNEEAPIYCANIQGKYLKTNIKELLPYLDKIELVLIMSVEPGKGGQKFMPIAIDKINELRKLNKNIIISVDGGINDETVRMVNTDMVVSGSYVCMSDNFEKNIEILKK